MNETNFTFSRRFGLLSGVLTTVSIAGAQTPAAHWSDEMSGNGLDHYVLSLEVFDDGRGPALYAGGAFTHAAGGVVVNRIAMWRAGQWSDLAGGVSGNNGGQGGNLAVSAMLSAFDGASSVLYVAGGFNKAGSTNIGLSIVLWTGAEWMDVGGGVGPSNACVDCSAGVYALASVPGSSVVIAAGTFGFAGWEPHNNIAAWDGQNWGGLGTGLQGFAPLPVGNALIYYDDGSGPVLYAGGWFLGAGGVISPGIARWDGISWSGFGSGVVAGPPTIGFIPMITEFAVFDDGAGPALYAAGNFVEVDGLQVGHIARWDGQNWSNVGGGTNGPLGALAVFDDGTGPALYVGGSFTSAGGVAAHNIAKWDGATWSELGTGVNGEVLAMTALNEGDCRKLYVGGLFGDAGGIVSENIAVWHSCTCYPDCDQSTGVGVLDLIDFICFGTSFVTGEPYACDCDTSTGLGVCDLLDFICFQTAFVAGCP